MFQFFYYTAFELQDLYEMRKYNFLTFAFQILQFTNLPLESPLMLLCSKISIILSVTQSIVALLEPTTLVSEFCDFSLTNL